MQPETLLPKVEPRHSLVEHGSGVERASKTDSLENGLKAGAERHEQASEPTAIVSDTNGLSGIFPPPIVLPNEPVNDDSVVIAVPMIANDDDLIEKEWVDRAKRIVADTRDDPYKQEQAVTELQNDYQKKRYGRERGGA